jgi:outer membrane protein TolC
MTPTRWLAVIAFAVTLLTYSVARWSRDQSLKPSSHLVSSPSAGRREAARGAEAAGTGKDRKTLTAREARRRTLATVEYVIPTALVAPHNENLAKPNRTSAASNPTPLSLPRAERGPEACHTPFDDIVFVSAVPEIVIDSDSPPAVTIEVGPILEIGPENPSDYHADHAILPRLSGDINSIAIEADTELDAAMGVGSVDSTIVAPKSGGDVECRNQDSTDERPWWDQKVLSPMRDSSASKPIALEDIILGALRYSPRVRAISDTPLIRETAIMEAQGQFDWRAFMESRFTDTSDPVGSTLTTGGPSRLEDEDWRYSAGLRRKTYCGGKFEIAQRIGLEQSNSQFFSPTDQANSKLSLNFTQPLLNGAGTAYNTSLILLAQIDTEMAQDEFSRQLQDHLLEVTRTYWELYLNRAVLLQKKAAYSAAAQILDELDSRRAVDSLQSQVVRARAAVAARQSDIIRWEMAVRNTESKLRVLVNDPQLLPNEKTELIPVESPNAEHIPLNLSDSLATALQHRPEIDQATQNVRAATVRLGVSKNELKPVLDFVAEAYASGLEGDFALGKAYGNQFSEGRPSYSVGLVFEVPICNREARARYLRRQLELEQLAHELQNVIETTKAEVEIAVRQVEAAYQEMHSKQRAVTATEEEVRYLEERWRLLPGEDQVVSFLLEDLLDAQDRLTDEQYDYVAAQVAYTLSIPELQRALGTLLEAEQVEVNRTSDGCKPTLILDKRPPTPR